MSEINYQFEKSCERVNDLLVDMLCEYIDKGFKENITLSKKYLQDSYTQYKNGSVSVSGDISLIFRDEGKIDLSDLMAVGGYYPTDGINYTVVTNFFPQGFDARQLDEDIIEKDMGTCVIIGGKNFVSDEALSKVQNFLVSKLNPIVKKVTGMTFKKADHSISIVVNYEM